MAGKGTVGQLLVEMRADLGKLRVDVKEMEGVFKGSFSKVESLAKSFGSILAASFSAGAIIAYGKQIVNLGGQLKDLSLQTGISGQTLSGLKSTLEENGTSLDAFAKGIFTLQKNLGGIKNESDPAAQAVKALGLNLDELRNADTETFLQLITDALGNVTNPINRAALGAQLLGKSFRELGPAIEQISGRLAEFRKNGISDEDIEVLDNWGDAWTRISNKVQVFVAGNLSQTIQDIDHLGTLLQKGALYWKQFWAGAFHEGFIDKEEIKRQLAELEGPQSHEPAKEAAAKFKALPDESAAKKASEEIKNMVEALRKSNAALQAQTIEFNYGKEAAQNYILAQQEMEENARHVTPAIKAEQERRRELTDQIRTETEAREKLFKAAEQSRKATPGIIEDITFGLTPEETNEAGVSLNDLKIKTKEFREEWEKLQLKLAVGIIKDEQQRKVTELTLQFIELANAAQKLGDAISLPQAEIDQAIEGIWQPIMRQIKETTLAKTEAEKLGEDIAGSITQGMRNTLLGIETGQQTLGEGMKNLVRNMLLELQGTIFDKTILEPLKNIAAGFITGLVGALDDAANKDLKKWAEGLGKQVSSWLGDAFSGLLGSFGGFGGSSTVAAGSGTLVSGMGYATGGMIPSFAKGGLFIGHGGEFVMQKKAVDNIGADTLGMMNKTGKMPGGGGSVVNVEINGDITPRQPNMTPDQVVKVTAGNITNDGMVMSAIEQRLRLRGK